MKIFKRILPLIFLIAILQLSIAQKAELVIPQGHTSAIYGLAYSKSGKLLLSGGLDSKMLLWDAESGREIRKFEGHTSIVRGVAFADNDRLVVSASQDRSAKIWNTKTGKIFKTLKHPKQVFALAVTPDGKSVLTGCDDKICRLWNVKTGMLIREFVGHKGGLHTGGVLSVAISPNGKLAASGNQEGEIKIWNLATGSAIKTINTNGKSVKGIDFSPDGKFLVSGGWDKIVKVWNVTSGQLAYSLTGHIGEVKTVKFSFDGKYIASGEKYYTVKVWDIEAKKELKSYRHSGAWVNTVAFHPKKNLLLTGDDKASLRLFDVNSSKKTAIKYYKGHPGKVNGVGFTPDGKYIISSHNNNGVLWDATSGKMIQKFKGHSKRINALAIDKKSQYFFTASDDASVKKWNINTGKLVKTFKEGKPRLQFVIIDADGKSIITRDYYRVIRNWDISSGKLLRTGEIESNSSTLVNIGLSNELITSYLGRINITNQQSGEVIRKFTGYNFAGVLELSPTNSATPRGKYMAISVDTDKTLKILNYKTGQVVKSFYHNKKYVRNLKYSPNGKNIITTTADSKLRLWNIATGKAIFTANTGGSTGLDVSQDGKQAITGSWENVAKLWNLKTGKEIASLINFDDSEEWIAVSPDRYFYGSKGISNSIYYVLGTKIFTFDQFDLQYNRPDIILKRMGRSSQALIDIYKSAYVKRLKRMQFSDGKIARFVSGDFSRKLNTPELTLINQVKYLETNDKQYSFSIEAKDPSGTPLERLDVRVNGVPIYGVAGKVIKHTGTGIFSYQVDELTLSNGSNKISVTVLNADGVSSLAESFEINYTGTPSKPSLHIIAIGVSEYKDSEMNLGYAAKDAKDFSNLLKEKKGKYKEIIIHQFLDKNAIRDAILGVKLELQKSQVDDQVIVFVAGHGLLDDKLDYYIATHDIDFNHPSEKGLKYESLENLLDGIPARKKLMFLDACHSGEIDKDNTVLTAAENVSNSSVKSRGFKKVVSKSNLGLLNSFELMKTLFNDIRTSSGTIVISSASGVEYAYESEEWNNGVFTYALLKGLKSRSSDTNKDGAIQISELRNYVFDKVEKLTNGKQHPTSRRENLEYDFVVW